MSLFISFDRIWALVDYMHSLSVMLYCLLMDVVFHFTCVMCIYQFFLCHTSYALSTLKIV